MAGVLNYQKSPAGLRVFRSILGIGTPGPLLFLLHLFEDFPQFVALGTVGVVEGVALGGLWFHFPLTIHILASLRVFCSILAETPNCFQVSESFRSFLTGLMW